MPSQAGQPNCLPRVEAYFCASGNTVSDPYPTTCLWNPQNPLSINSQHLLAGPMWILQIRILTAMLLWSCGRCWEALQWETSAVLGSAGASPSSWKCLANWASRIGYRDNTGHLLVPTFTKSSLLILLLPRGGWKCKSVSRSVVSNSLRTHGL